MDKKIQLLFDANPLVKQKTGVGYYTEGIIKALSEIPQLELKGFYFGLRGQRPQLPKAVNLSYVTCPWLVGQAAKALRKIGIRLPWELLARSRADILFFPDFTSWPSLFGTPKILVIHDLTFVDFPQYVRKPNLRYMSKYVKRDAKKADLILTISEFSKRRIVDEFGIPANKVMVQLTPPPPTMRAKKMAGMPAKYILAISTIEPRKNFQGLAEAYSRLADQVRREFSLVVAGGEGWDAAETINYIRDLQHRGEKIILTGYVSDEARAALYQHASLVVMPSFYEGLGMPILEAMAYGAPVAVSDIPVFHEVAGGAAVFFDPSDINSISSSLQTALTNQALRERLIKAGYAQVKKHSWSKVAKELYQKIAEFEFR